MHVLPLYDVARHLHGINLHIPATESDVHLTCFVIHEYNHVKSQSQNCGFTEHVRVIKKKNKKKAIINNS